jgi:hypothetical protein
VLAEALRVVDRRHRVVVHDEVVRLVLPVEVDVLPDGTEVVAEVEPTGGLDAGDDDRFFRGIRFSSVSGVRGFH